jgi:hypothetical protein
VERDVAVVVELSQRDAEPEARSDLDHRVDGQRQELPPPQTRPRQELHREAREEVGVDPCGSEELAGCRVVDEAGKALVSDREVAGEEVESARVVYEG